MLGPIRSLALAFLLFQLSPSANAQTAISPPPKEVRNAIEQLPAEQRSTVRSAIAATQPFVIFLPGVLGSKLDEGSHNIFGVGIPSAEIAYVEGKQVSADLLDEMKLLPIQTPFTNAYAKPVSYMQGVTLREGAGFRFFPYDWRQSNIRSAEQFSNFICTHIEEIRSRPVIFIAHSMGGIVLKYWLAAKYHSAACGAEKIDQAIPVGSIKHVIFVGTPHLGAPKALSALLDNYYLIGDRDGSYLKRMLNNAIARNLNDYGSTFPSAYELLPRLSPDCAATWANPPARMNVNGSDGPLRNIFDIELWKTYNWPKGPYANDPRVRDQFLASNLATFLKKANELTCTLAKYDIDKEFKVTRFYGGDLVSTDCSVIVNVGVYRGKVTLGFRTCAGDGTVPVESANERGDGLPLPGEHLELLSAKAFTSFLAELYAQNMRDLDAEYARKTGSNLGPVELRIKLDQVIPPSPSPASEADRIASDITVRTNEAVVERRDQLNGLPAGTTASRIYDDARTQSNKTPLERANGYRIAAELKDTNGQRKAWALNNSADISLKQKDFSKAKAIALKALQEADAVQRKHPELREDMRRLKGLAAWTIAISSKKLGQLADVDEYRRLAIQNGNSKARRVQI
jgi:pimeloyl-ACP methyl ester carboxylesterase